MLLVPLVASEKDQNSAVWRPIQCCISGQAVKQATLYCVQRRGGSFSRAGFRREEGKGSEARDAAKAIGRGGVVLGGVNGRKVQIPGPRTGPGAGRHPLGAGRFPPPPHSQ